MELSVVDTDSPLSYIYNSYVGVVYVGQSIWLENLHDVDETEAEHN